MDVTGFTFITLKQSSRSSRCPSLPSPNRFATRRSSRPTFSRLRLPIGSAFTTKFAMDAVPAGATICTCRASRAPIADTVAGAAQDSFRERVRTGRLGDPGPGVIGDVDFGVGSQRRAIDERNVSLRRRVRPQKLPAARQPPGRGKLDRLVGRVVLRIVVDDLDPFEGCAAVRSRIVPIRQRLTGVVRGVIAPSGPGSSLEIGML